MAEIKEFKPSTKERPKPEKPADLTTNEEFEKRRQGILRTAEKRAAESPRQSRQEVQRRFIEKIEEVKKRLKKIEEEHK